MSLFGSGLGLHFGLEFGRPLSSVEHIDDEDDDEREQEEEEDEIEQYPSQSLMGRFMVFGFVGVQRTKLDFVGETWSRKEEPQKSDACLRACANRGANAASPVLPRCCCCCCDKLLRVSNQTQKSDGMQDLAGSSSYYFADFCAVLLVAFRMTKGRSKNQKSPAKVRPDAGTLCAGKSLAGVSERFRPTYGPVGDMSRPTMASKRHERPTRRWVYRFARSSPRMESAHPP